MKILILFISLLPNLCLAGNISYFDYIFTIPEQYNVFDDDPLAKDKVFVVNKNKKAVLVVEKIQKNKNHFWPLKQYGKNTHRELFYELFSDTPTDNKAVLEIREIYTHYKTQKTEITEKNGFVFFRIDNPIDMSRNTKIIISTPLNDEVLNLSFTDKASNKFINSVIKSFTLKDKQP